MKTEIGLLPTILFLVAAAVAFAVLLAATAQAQSVRGSVPDAPDPPAGTAIFIGGIDLEWDDVPGADSYDVQLYRNGLWRDLPGDGIEIAFYGAGAIISGLDPESTLWFRVRATNSFGSSDWSAWNYMSSMNQSASGQSSRPDNVSPTGAPAINGTAQIGEVLTADTTAIEDGNGLDRVQFRFQWISDDGSADTDIAGATDSTYTLVPADRGKTIKVRVAFTDRGGYAELLTSGETASVISAIQGVSGQGSPQNSPATGAPTISGIAQVGETLAADTSGIADADGLTNVSYSYQWVAYYGNVDMDIMGAANSAYRVAARDEGKTIKVRVSFTDDAGHDETLTSMATDVVTFAVQQQTVNTPATWVPTVSGAAKPTNLSALPLDNGIRLNWQAPQADAADVTGYRIFRKRPDEGESKLTKLLDNTGSTSTSYLDDTATEDGVRYVFRVRALRGNTASEMSNRAEATYTAPAETPAPTETPEPTESTPAPRSSHESDDATLSDLSVSPKNINGFSADRRNYQVGVGSTSTQAIVSAVTNDSGASAVITPGDADGNTAGHQVDLQAGRNEVTITVTAEDMTTTRKYTVSINRGVDDPKGWDAGKDFDTLEAAGNEVPGGLWSNGATMWVVDEEDSKIYAYDLTTKARDESKDFDTLAAAGNEDPRGLWADDTTMWVSDDIDNKIYAYNLETKARDDSKDFDTLDDTNAVPKGLWSDGDTMWVVDQSYRRIYAYTVATKARDRSKDFDLPVDLGSRLYDIWTNGTTLWLGDSLSDVLLAYNFTSQARIPDGTFNTLAASNDSPRGIWSDGDTMWVADSFENKIYAYNMPPPSDIVTLSSLTVAPKDIHGFDPERASYQVGVYSSVTQATVMAQAADPAASVEVTPADARTNVSGHQVNLQPGRNAVTITVTAESGETTRKYTVSINQGVDDAMGWNAGNDFDTLDVADNHRPTGIWSDGATMWVADDDTYNKIFAYSLATTTRDSSKDFDTLEDAGNRAPAGLWSNGATMWVADQNDSELYAYTIATKARDSTKDFDNLDSDNYEPYGLWSNRDTIWVVDSDVTQIFAYSLATQAREDSKDFPDDSLVIDLVYATDIWSDGTTLWIADIEKRKIFAYNLESKARVSTKDFDTLRAAGNREPTGIWSDGTTMWVADNEDKKIYAYNMPFPPQKVLNLSASPRCEEEVGLTWDIPKRISHTHYQYRYITAMDSNWNDWQDIPGSDPHTNSYNVTGLSSARTYTFQVRTTNGTDHSDASPTARAAPSSHCAAHNKDKDIVIQTPFGVDDPNEDHLRTQEVFGLHVERDTVGSNHVVYLGISGKGVDEKQGWRVMRFVAGNFDRTYEDTDDEFDELRGLLVTDTHLYALDDSGHIFAWLLSTGARDSSADVRITLYGDGPCCNFGIRLRTVLGLAAYDPDFTSKYGGRGFVYSGTHLTPSGEEGLIESSRVFGPEGVQISREAMTERNIRHHDNDGSLRGLDVTTDLTGYVFLESPWSDGAYMFDVNSSGFATLASCPKLKFGEAGHDGLYYDGDMLYSTHITAYGETGTGELVIKAYDPGECAAAF